MGQERVSEDGIKVRKQKIDRWLRQIDIWEATGEKSEGLELIRSGIAAGRSVEEKEILKRVKTLSFTTEADRADIAKIAGRLEAYDSIYYDMFDASKKIDNARLIIEKLKDEIKRAKKGELLDTGA